MTSPLSAFRISGGGTFEEAKEVEIVDQLVLPHTVQWESVNTIEGAFAAIKSMKIRGAPAIASLASLGIASELYTLLSGSSSPAFPVSSLESTPKLLDFLLQQTAYLLTSRPTAVNLLEALNRIEAVANSTAAEAGATAEQLAKAVIKVAIEVFEEDKERCQRIGDNGADWIVNKLEGEGSIEKGEKIAVLTVCNTGSLATSGYGTALGVIASLAAKGRLLHAYFAQTGPYQQGARLTSLELASLGVKNTMVCDTAIGALIAEKRIHLFVAGADRSVYRSSDLISLRHTYLIMLRINSYRIAANGDTANKISTYQISHLCSSPHPFSPNPPVPVLVAAPVATLDLAMESGRSIVIEQRPSWEACTVRGRVVDVAQMAKSNGTVPQEQEIKVATVLITPPGTRAWNPAFDVTPAGLISGIVTEFGVAHPLGKDGHYDLQKFVSANRK
ncbi:BQ5605_C010g05839 [Microbotryum silenes-dioicae]|uniref:BQ5605_C010g05839 protein n=1 Tax=Microbotryum silenes-dioicae TaxID=796604 RepID=A0A2X0LU10_9BASI|nr:BQ5605_C010g05839 [Microbotryum silenes-dioicae]